MTERPSHPYEDIADHQRWSRAVTWAPPGGVDPVVHARFRITPEDRISTMGSCFAQHLSRHLERSGLGYHVAETAPAGMDPAEARRRQYGTFSARYGNVYTVDQAVQLVRRAYGDLEPVDEAWTRGSVLVDPFRPQVEPDGFADLAALRVDRTAHLAATRAAVEEADVLVFTLGLTEAWRSRHDGCVFPVAPGVSGGEWSPDDHEFVNSTVEEVTRSLDELCELLRSVNPQLRVLLTVSPVPLIATYEDRHVLVSTTLSKAVLRVAADAALRRFDFVDYFPSFELIASSSAGGQYLEPDLREVRDVGVAHVMRCFSRHYVEGAAAPPATDAPPPPPVGAAADDSLVCDEEAVEAALAASRGGG